MVVKKIIQFFSNSKYEILIFLITISCFVPAPPKYIEYKIIDSTNNSKDLLVFPTFNYNYITYKINSTIKIVNISDRKQKLNPFKYSYESKNTSVCFDSLEVIQKKVFSDSFLKVEEIEILPKDTINIQMRCSKNTLQKVILEKDTVNLSIQIQNNKFEFQFIPIRK